MGKPAGLPLSSKPMVNTGVSIVRAIGVAPVWARPLDEAAKPPASAVADDLRNVRRLITLLPRM